MKIHHATAKKAKAHGITLTVEDGEIVASKDKTHLASGLMANVVLQTAIDKLAVEFQSSTSAAAVKSAQPKRAKLRKAAAEADLDDDTAAEYDEEIEAGQHDDAADEDEEPAEGKSIIKAKYKAIYKPTRMTNGDDLNALLRNYLYVVTDAGEERINPARLKKFAKANECWVESYSSLKNIGMIRMNVCNRLRAKLRRDPEYKVEWPK